MAAEKPRYLFTAIDPEGRAIHLHDHTAIHIMENHPETTINIPRIKETIEYPECIKESDTIENSLIYITKTQTQLDYNVTTKIGMEFADGIVTSAYVSSTPLPGKVVWTK